MSGSGLTKQEQIDSHSSMLTNRLIVDQACTKVWAYEILAWENPFLFEPAIRYWCAVQGLYTQCSFFFATNALKDKQEILEEYLKSGMSLLMRITAGRSSAAPELVWKAWQLHMLVRQAGQVLGFWTRMSRVKAKGIAEHIEMFERINPLESQKHANKKPKSKK